MMLATGLAGGLLDGIKVYGGSNSWTTRLDWAWQKDVNSRATVLWSAASLSNPGSGPVFNLRLEPSNPVASNADPAGKSTELFQPQYVLRGVGHYLPEVASGDESWHR